jgi:hypothetical protein
MQRQIKTANILYVIEQHAQLLELWHSLNSHNLKIVHFDYHCDMRGLLMDCERQLAFPASNLKNVDEGNFLTHAIAEKRVESIQWIHDIPGGRKYDVGTVMYLTDISVQPRRWLLSLKRQDGIPIKFKVSEFSHWNETLADEFLDIDWDFFAAKDYPPDTIEARVDAFFNKGFRYGPKQISVCYSPRYSHPSRDKFEEFVERLAIQFQSEIIYLPAPMKLVLKEPSNKRIFDRLLFLLRYQIKHLRYETILWLRKRNIY